MFFICQNFKSFHVTYSVAEKVTSTDIFYLKFYFSLHQKNTVRKCTVEKKQTMKHNKEKHISLTSDDNAQELILFFNAQTKNSLSTIFYQQLLILEYVYIRFHFRQNEILQFGFWSNSFSCLHEIALKNFLQLLFHCCYFDKNEV